MVQPLFVVVGFEVSVLEFKLQLENLRLKTALHYASL
jgi:hypothetical protein